MRFFNTIFASAIIAMSLSSCGGDDKNETTLTYGMLYYSESPAASAYSIGQATYKLNFSETKGSSIQTEKVLLPGSGSFVSLNWDNLYFFTSNSSFDFRNEQSAANSTFTAAIKGVAMNGYIWAKEPNVDIYGVSLRQTFLSIATSVSATNSDDRVSTSQADKNVFGVVINEVDVNTPSRTLNLIIDQASFKNDMKSYLLLKNIPFEISGGILSFSADEIIPYTDANATNQSKTVKIVDIAASGELGKDMNITFVFRESGQNDTYTDYNVSATLKDSLGSASTGTYGGSK